MEVRIEHITKFYGQQKALDNVSFNLKKGEIVGFIGPNGAGKSTLMKIMTGYLLPSEGNVFYDNLNIIEHVNVVKKFIGYLPEHNPLYLQMYVSEYLMFVAGMYNIREKKRDRIEEMIQLTGLISERKKQIGSLSKGYRQRVGIAQALIHNPEVLILDEPTSGLDPNQIIEIRNLIKNIARDKCVMLSTHIMQEVEAICDRIILIHKGNIVTNEDTKRIKQDSFTLFVEFNMPVDDQFFEIEGIIKYLKKDKNIYWIECRNIDVREKIFHRAVEKGVVVLSLLIKEKPLEEVFRDMTKS